MCLPLFKFYYIFQSGGHLRCAPSLVKSAQLIQRAEGGLSGAHASDMRDVEGLTSISNLLIHLNDGNSVVDVCPLCLVL